MKRPILTSLFNILGLLVIAVGLFGFVAGMLDENQFSVGAAVLTCFYGIFLLGIAQAVFFLAKTAHHAEKIEEIAEYVRADLRRAKQ